MQIYLSSGAFRTRSLREIVQFSLDHDLAYLELSSGIRYEPYLLNFVRSLPEFPFHYLVHNYFPPPAAPFVLNLASSDEQLLQLSCELCHTAIDLAGELGSPFYSVHSGFAVHLTPELLGDPEAQAQVSSSAYISYDAAYARFVETVMALTIYAKSRGVRLLIENNVVSPLYLAKHGHNPFLMATAPEIVQLMEDISDPNLGVLVDVGHVNVSATALNFQPENFLETVGPYIGAFHLSDNDGQSDLNLPFDKKAWFCQFLPHFRTLPLVIEAYRLSLEQIHQQYRVLEEVLG